MWWTRVSYCALSLIIVLGPAGCGTSGFQGQSGDDALTMSFLGFTGEGIMQQDTVGNTSADVDICQDICSIGAGLLIGQVVFETFTSTTANAQFVNNGTADILISEYTVSTPGLHVPARTVTTAVLLPGGRCSNLPSQHCGFDTDCIATGGTVATCNHEETNVEILLYSLTEKQLIVGDQMCPELDTTTVPFTVIPGNVTPQTHQTDVTFRGSDETGKEFVVNAGLVGTFSDFINCNTSGTGTGSGG